MRLHVVIPAFNEADRLPSYLARLARMLEEVAPEATILVVDDGSRTENRERLLGALEGIRARHANVRAPLLLPENVGKGGAVRAGWDAADKGAEWLLFVDADGSISETEVRRVILSGSDAVADAWFGARIKMLGRSVTRNWRRHLSGRLFASLVGRWLDAEVYDTQCGFKGVSAAAWRRIRPQLSENGFVFDVEWLVALRRAGLRVVEVPIDWHDTPGSKVSLVRDAWRMLLGLRRIRRRLALGALG